LHTQEIGKNLFMVDLETGGLKNLICSYIIKGKNTFIVESGPTNSVPKLLQGLKELDVTLEEVAYVAVTHVHLDHGGGAGTLLKSLPNAKVLVHPKGLPHLVDPTRLWASSQSVLGFVSEVFGKPEPVPKNRVIPVTDETFDLGYGAKLSVMETIGHASHNLSFQETFNNGIFPGDAAGTYFGNFDAVVPTSPPPFHLEASLASLEKLISLKPDCLYYSHFGKASNAVGHLKDYMAQLKLWGKIALEGVSANRTVEQIRREIFAQDPVMRKLEPYLKAHPIYSITALGNTVQGFIDYAKRTVSEKS
jgi:glyoxylase-like metal-dependent hydrolase (beta-lactamase superfamily II)